MIVTRPMFYKCDNLTCRDGTCSLKISLEKFSLGRNVEDCCWNQLFTVLGPGVVGQGPLLCGQHRHNSGASGTGKDETF